MGQALGDSLKVALADLNIAGASLSIDHGGRVQTVAAGFANVPAQIEATEDTVFQIGSITKAFTATLIGRFVDQGRLAFDDRVSRYLPALKIDGAPVPDTLTLRTLLDHSAGFEGDYFADFGADPDSLQAYVAACAKLRYLHEPGTMQSYNSAAYCIAGRVIEVVTGQFYNDALAHHLLKPLGLEQYSFYDHDIARYRAAVGHAWSPAEQSYKIPDVLRLPHCMSASGASLSMTARDLLRFGQLHRNGGVNEVGKHLLDVSIAEEMWTPRRFTPPGNKPLLMSWAILDTSTGPLYATSGQTVDQNALLVFSPTSGIAASILTNGAGAANQVFSAVLAPWLEAKAGIAVQMPAPAAASDAVEAPVKDLDWYAGTYANQTQLQIQVEGEGLLACISAKATTHDEMVEETLHLKPIGAHRFTLHASIGGPAIGQMAFLVPSELGQKPDFVAMSNRLYRRF